MTVRRLTHTLALVTLLFAVLAFAPRRVTPPATVAFAQSDNAQPDCVEVGGMIMTNLGVIPPATTLGTATGDLKGAVAATILNVSPPAANGTTVFTVQHHFVTETGDTVSVDVAQATVAPVEPGRLAVVSYPVKIIGGTGKFAGATGTINNIGEVDLPNFPNLAGGKTVFRYTGQVCFAAPGDAGSGD